MKQNKIISGLDVVKFIMAIMIVDSHVKGYLITPPARPRTAVLGCIIEGRTAITTPPKPF